MIYNMTIQQQNENFRSINQLLLMPEKFFKQYAPDMFSTKACYSYSYLKYGFMDTWDTCINLLNNLPKQKRIFNELVTKYHKVKPYLDVEWYKEEYNYDPDEIKIIIKKTIIKVFEEHYSINIKFSNIKIGKCHRNTDKGYKYSFHFIINTEAPMYIFDGTLKAFDFANKCRTELSLNTEYSKEIIDLSVYKTTQNFRLIGQCKAGDFDNPILMEEENDNILEYIVSNISRTYEYIKVDEQEDSEFIKLNPNSVKNISSELQDLILEKAKILHETAIFTGLDSQGFFQFNYKDRKEKCFCNSVDNIYHDKIGFFGYINQQNILCFGCHSNRCSIDNKKVIVPSLNIQSYLYDKIDTNQPVNDSNDFSYISFDIIKNCINNNNKGLAELLEHMFLLPIKRVIHIGSERKMNRKNYIWNGDYWEEDINETLFHITVTSLVSLLKNTKEQIKQHNDDTTVYSDDYNKNFISLIDSIIPKLNSGTIIDSILRFFNNRATDKTFLDKKDLNFYKLSCKNGLVNLKTLEMRPRKPEDFITKVLKTEYNPDADTSLFDSFIRNILKNIDDTLNEDKYTFFKWCIGQALTRDPKKIFVIFYGPESYNGKSTFVGILKQVLEWLTDEVDSSVVLEAGMKSKGSHSSELIVLKDLAYAFITETTNNNVINDAQVKRITGRDDISARQIYKEQETFKSRCVPFICTNKVIKLDLKDRALYERTVIFKLLLSFVNEPKKIYERQRDIELENKLSENKEGVLKWLVEAGNYYSNNMNIIYPKFVDEEKESYMLLVDPYYDFLSKNFITDKKLTDKQKMSKEYQYNIQELISQFQEYLIENCISRIPKKDILENFKKLFEINGENFIGIKTK